MLSLSVSVRVGYTGQYSIMQLFILDKFVIVYHITLYNSYLCI